MVLVSWLSALRRVLRRPAGNRTPWKPELALAGSSIERFRPPVKLAPEIESFEERTLLSVTTFTVNTTADTADVNPGDGLAVDMFGTTSLRAAIQEANAASEGVFEILVPSGTYLLTRTGAGEDAAGTGDLDILPGPDLLTIRSKGIGEESEPVIRGQFQDRIFDIHANATLILEDIIIRDGTVTDDAGGAIRNAGVLNMIRGEVTDSIAESSSASPALGGAIHNTGFLSAAAVEFAFNQSSGHGGAVYNVGSASFDQAIFFNNLAANGGPADGGAVFNTGAGTLILSRSDLSENSGQRGGAIFNAGNASVVNSTIGANQANDGGGILNDGPQAVLNLTHVTIAQNSATNEGGGLFHSGTTAAANVSSSIIALNTATTAALSDIAGRPTSFGGNVIGIGGVPSGFVDGVNADRVGSTSTPLDPLLTALGSNGGFTQTFALQAGSPAIDNASGFLAPGVSFESDQRGAPRLINGFRDSGAYESGFTGVFVNTTEDTNDADLGDGIAADSLGLVSLRAAIQEANTSFEQIPEIVLSPGVYRLTILGDDDNAEFGDLDLYGAHSLLGTSSQSVVIDAGGNDRVIDVTGGFSSPSLITGVTLQNGATDSYGGGLRSFGALTLIDVRIQDSSAELDGGGIANYGSLSLYQSQLLRNSAVVRGGAIASDGFQLTVENSFLNGNSVTGDPNDFFAVGGGAVAVAGDATIRNSTLQGNSTTGSGGAIAVDFFGTLSLQDSIVTGNSANRSGGAIASEGSTQIIRSLLQNNSADQSGGGVAISAGTLEVTGTGMTGNVAGEDGGGLYTRNAEQVTIQFSFIENNLARHGGGLNVGATTATIQNSTIADNSATENGGGLQLTSGMLDIRNSTISTNTADGAGGGIINENGHLTLLNATVTGNTAGMDGGGLFNTTGGRTFSGNTIVAGNQLISTTANDVAGGRVITSLGSNLIGVSGTGFVDGLNGDLVGTAGTPLDPLLGPLTSNGGSTRTHSLLPGSPAIDTGNNALPSGPVEQRGSQRSIGLEVPTIDIGATEFNQTTTFYVNTIQDTSDIDPGDGVAQDSFGTTSLRAAIQEANALNEPVTIVLPAGIYRLNQFGPGDNESLSGDLDVTGDHPLAIYGAGKNATVIDGAMSDRVFDVIEAQLRLEGMTLTNGAVFAEDGGLLRAARNEDTLAGGDGVSRVELINVDLVGGQAVDGNGGALSIRGGDSPSALLMSGGTVRNSHAEGFAAFGGAIHSVDTDVSLTEIIVSENTAGSSGGGVYFDGGVLSLQRSLVEKNSATFGGGIAILEFAATGTASIEMSRILENTASFGGGIYTAATLALSDSEVAVNQAQSDGGGIYNEGNLEVTGTWIHANSGFQLGGGIYSLTQLLLQDSEVSDNSVSTAGGGLFSAGTASVIRTTVSGNSAITGGGIFAQGLMSLIDSTVSGNFASSMGGGVFAGLGGTLQIQGSTVTANFAGISGGGVTLEPGESGSVTLVNTLIALNSTSSEVEPDVSGEFISSGHNLIGDPGASSGFTNGVMSDIVGGTLIGPVTDLATDGPIIVTVTGHGLQTGDRVRIEGTSVFAADGSFQVTVLDQDRFELDGTGGGETYTGGGEVFRLINPRIGALSNNTTVSGTSSSPAHPGTSGPVVTRTHALLPGSLAIDFGNNAAISPEETDQRGFFRPVDGDADSLAIVDIGAFELLHTTVTGRIFSDADGDGFQSSGEPGLFGRVVYADLNGNGQFDASLEPSTQTLFDIFETPEDETGQFVLEFVPPGDVTIAVVVTDGERISAPQAILFSTPASVLAERDIPELVQPFDVASVDLNGDGALDLVTTASSSGQVIVSLTGATPLTTLTRSYAVGTGPENLEVADLNADGFQDLIFTVKGADQIGVLMNRGDGTFSDPALVTVGDEPRDFVLADLTGDGVLDIAVANGAGHSVTILEGNGSGGFINPETVLVGQSPRAIEFMERRGPDGWRLVTADKDSDQLSFIRRTGSGFEVAEVLSLDNGTLPSTLLATDLDFDGVTDLLIGQEGTGTVEVLYGRINAPLAQPSTFTSPGFVTDLDAVDLDGDLDLDVLILGGSSNGTVTVVTNLGSGNPGDRSFSAGTIVGVGTNPSRLRVVQDPAGNGRPDLLIASLNSDEILRLTNLTGSGFISTSTGVVADAGSFGIEETGSIYGTVFDDPDQSQFQDFNEQRLSGIEVYLDLNLNGVRDSFEPVATTQADDPLTSFSDETGQYSFLNLPIGRQYQVGVSLPGHRAQVTSDSPQFLTRPAGVVTGQVVDQVSVDLDGDGNLDLLVMTNIGTESFFRIFMGDGTGALTGGSTLAGGDAADHFTVLDVDGDEDSDVAVVRSNGTLDLYGNNSGTLAFDRQLAVAPGMTRIRSADMNGDGRADLILSTDSAGPSDSAFQVLINDPDQSDFNALAVGPTTIGISVADFAVADVNGDGTLDIAAVGPLAENTLYVFLNDGDGDLSLQNSGALAGTGAISLALADFNGDGALDAAVTTLDSAFLEIQYGIALGAGSFTGSSIQSVSAVSGTLLVDDLNGDGRPDIVIDGGQFGTYLLVNDGSLTFATYILDSSEAISLTSGDFDGDGRADLSAASPSDGILLRLLLNRTDQRTVDVIFSGLFSSPPADFATTLYAQVSGTIFADQDGSGQQESGEDGLAGVTVFLDLNQNGELDSFEPQTTTDDSGSYLLDRVYPQIDENFVTVRIIAPAGFGVTSPRNLHLALDTTVPAGFGAQSVAAGDLNADGETDLVVVNGDGSLLIALRQSGLFSYQTVIPGGGRVPQRVQLADLNNDGALDIITVNDSNTIDLTVLYGIGDGTFGNQTDVSLPGLGRQIAVADLTADGFLDVVVVAPFSGQILILHNDGTGQLELQPELSTSGFPHALVTGDFDGDGILDLAVADLGADVVLFFAGRAGGTFAAPVISTADDGIHDIAAGDFNEDGDLDVAVISGATGQLTILTGDGTGGFAASVTIPLEHPLFFSGPGNLIATDINGDGHVDLAITDNGNARGVVFGGDGSGAFPLTEVVEAVIDIGAAISRPVAADLNGDGLPELIVTNLTLGAVHLLENQAATARIPAAAGEAYSAVTFGVQSSNQAPVIQVPVSVATPEDTSFVFSSGAGTAIVVSDPDAADSDLELSLSVTNGQLTLGAFDGLFFLQGDGINDSGLTVRGSVTSINAALEELSYAPLQNFDGSSQLAITVSDLGHNGAGGPRTATASVSLTVTPVNDAPVIQVPGTQTVTEDSLLTFSVPGGNAILVQDVDALLAEITLSATQGTLTLGSASGLTFSSGDGISDAAMTFSGPLSLINAALDGLQFTPTFNFTGPAQLNITANDLGQSGAGGSQISNQSVSINVSAVNDAPVVSVPGTQTISEDSALTFSGTNGNAIVVSDVDATTGQATLTVTNGVLTLSGTAGLTLTDGDGTADATMTFTGTLASINTALNGLIFVPNGNFNGNAQLNLDVRDQGNTGTGGVRIGSGSVTIAVTEVNDGPVLNVPGPQTVTEDALLIFSPAGGNTVSVGDVDAVTLQLTLSVTSGRISLGTLAGLTFQTGDGINDSTMTLTGSPANINAALDGLAFEPIVNFTGDLTLNLTVSDLGQSGSGGTLQDSESVSISVSPVNDAPVVQAPASAGVLQDMDLIFSVAEGRAITVSDVDAGADSVELSLSVQNGRLTLATIAGLSFTAGDGNADSTMTFTGTVSDINAALDGLLYRPDPGVTGADQLSLLLSDLGHTGAGIPQTASHTVELTIGAVNAPPVFPSQTIEFTIDEHTTTGTLIHTVLVSDPDSEPSDLSFAIADGNTDGAFEIHPETGALTVASSAALNFESQSTFSLTIQVTDSRPVAPTPLTASQVFTIHLNDLVESFVIDADAFEQGSVTLRRDGNLLRAVDAQNMDLVPPAQFDRVQNINAIGRPGQNDVLQVLFGSVPLVSGGTTISAPALQVLGDLTSQAGVLDVTGDLTATGLFAPASGSRFRGAVTAEAGAFLNGITVDGDVLIAGPTTISGAVVFSASAALTGPATVNGTLTVPNEPLLLTGDVILNQGMIQADAGTQLGGQPPLIGGGGTGTGGTGGTGGGIVIGFSGGIVAPLTPVTLSGEGTLAGGLLQVMSNGVINPSGVSQRITLPATLMSPGSVLHADLREEGTSDSVQSSDLLTPNGAILQPVLLQPAGPDATFIIVQNDGTGIVSSGLFGPAIDSGTGTDLGSSQILVTNLTDGRATLFSDSFGRLDDGTFDPVGPAAEAGAIFESSVFFRSNGSGPRGSLSELGTNASTIRGTDQEGNSSFQIGNLLFTLTQTLTPIVGTDSQIIGSLLTQTYVVTNLGSMTEEFELARYLDADLLFDGTLSDRGGRLVTESGVELLYEIDSGSSGPSSSTLVGITAIGGTQPQTGRFAIDSYSGLRLDLQNGLDLDDQIEGDTDQDGIIDDGAEYDVTLAFLNLFALSAGESDIYTTHTILATGLPQDVVQAGDTTFNGLPEGSGLDVPILNELNQVVGTQRFVISYSGGDGNDIELRVSSGISGRAWQDLNGDGVRDLNDPALAGVAVRLFDQETGDLLISTTTSQEGLYHFDDLLPGSYFVEFTAPDGQILTLRDAAADDIDSDANRLTGRTSAVSLEGGQSLSGVDAGFIEARVSIQGPEAVDEGPLGAVSPVDFTVTLNGPSMVPVTVFVQAFSGQSGPVNSRATLGTDFQQIPSGQALVTFQPGQTSQQVRLNVTGDNLPEQDETFEVRLLNATQATVGQETAVVTIINDDVETPRVVLSPVASVIEGQAPDIRPLDFSVRLLGGPVGQNITVSYETILPPGLVPAGVATPGVDYVAASGNVIIPAGQTTASIRLQVIGDRAIELDETLQIRLTGLQAGTTGAVLGNVTQATGTIINDDVAVPVLALGNAETVEQNAPRRVALQFPVTLNGPSDQDVTITFSTLPLTGTGTATAGVDYVAVSGKTLVIPRGRTSGVLEIEVIGDSTIEPDEVVAVEITAVANAILRESVGIGTIINDDFARPKVLLRDASILEGRQGQVTPLHFELIMTGALSQDVVVTVSTAALNQTGAATAGSDFEAVTSRQVRIPAGMTSVLIPVQIFGDELEENDEQFRLLITQAGAAVDIDPTRQQATGTIRNDDRNRPMVSVDRETSARELDAPRTSTADFVVRLDAVSNQEVTVAFRTQEVDAPGAAIADVDFRAVNSGLITFAPGETEKIVQIVINGDDLIEPPETFFLELTGITAGAADLDPFQRFSQAVIFDNDEARPAVSLTTDINVLEPDNNGRSVAELAVNLTSAHSEDIAIHYVTRSGPPPGSATPGSDFTDAASGTLIIPAGAMSGIIRIEILGDRLIEGDETFVVELVEVTSANADLPPGGRQAVVTIVDNDFARPTVSLSATSVIEGDPGDDSELVFLVTLSGPAPTSTVQVELETFRLAEDLPGLARSEGTGRDYFATTRTLTFEPGVTTKEFRVRVVPDDAFEATEQVFARITSATGAAIDLAGASISGFIINDDPPEPVLSINSVRVLEGDAPGEMSLTFEVTLDADPEAGVIPDVTVNYTTIDLSALAGQDYTATSGTLTFTDGIRSQFISVPVLGNTVDDGLRELLVELSSPMGAMLHPGAFQGLGTIRDDDSPGIVFEIDSVQQREGSSGTTSFDFTITRIGKSSTPVSVNYATQPGTATAGVDYTARSGTVTFMPGSSPTQTVSISVTGDQAIDSEFETFFVTLDNPVGGTLDPATRQGTGTILDDDAIVFDDDADVELMRIAAIIQDAISQLGNDPDNQELIDLITQLSREVLQRVGLSSGFVYVTDPVDFLLTDTAGRTTGYTQTAGEVTQAARSYYSGDRNVELVVIPQAAGGVYGLQLSGVGSGEFRAAATLVREDGTAKTLTQAGTLSGNVQLALDFSDAPLVRFDRDVVAQLADNLRNNNGVTGTNRQIAASEEAMQAIALAQAGLRDAVTDNSRPISAGDAFGRLFSVFSQAGQSLAGEFTRQFNELLRDLGGGDASSEPQAPEEAERGEAVDQFWSRLGRTLIGAPGNLLDLSEFFEVLTPESESPDSTPSETPQNEGNSDGKPADQAPPSNAGPKTTAVERPVNRFRAWAESRYARSDADKPSPWQPVSRPKADKVEPARNSAPAARQPETKQGADLARRDERPRPDDSGNSGAGRSDDAAG